MHIAHLIAEGSNWFDHLIDGLLDKQARDTLKSLGGPGAIIYLIARDLFYRIKARNAVHDSTPTVNVLAQHTTNETSAVIRAISEHMGALHVKLNALMVAVARMDEQHDNQCDRLSEHSTSLAATRETIVKQLAELRATEQAVLGAIGRIGQTRRRSK